MKLPLAGLGALGFALCLIAPASTPLARSAIGEVVAVIDGTSYRGETLTVPSEGTSTAEVMSIGPVTIISIQAHDPEADSIMQNVLSIELTLMGNDSSAPLTGAEVSWWPEGMDPPFYLSEGSGHSVEVVIDELSLEDSDAAIKGSFSGLTCRQDGMFEEMDTNDCLSIEGTFDTTLLKAK